MGSTGTAKPTQTPDELRAELKSKRQKYADFVKSHMADEQGGMNLTEEEMQEMKRLQADMDNTEYELHKQLKPNVPEEKWKGDGITALTYEEAATARKDLLKNKDFYMAVKSAEHGVSFDDVTHDTAVDAIYKNNPTKIYNIFSATRKALQQKYGDEITLYRVQTQQTPKTTVNMTSTRENAQQYAQIYGGRVEAIKVPTKDILAVNLSRTGGYEEFIVLNKRR